MLENKYNKIKRTCTRNYLSYCTIKTTKKVEIVNYKSDSKNNLIITLKNKSEENINANSLAIFKEGSKTGELIREKLNGFETKTFYLKIKINTKRKNILYIFEKQ